MYFRLRRFVSTLAFTLALCYWAGGILGQDARSQKPSTQPTDFPSTAAENAAASIAINDLDGDQRLSRKEASPFVSRTFDEFDADHNDYLDRKELAKLLDGAKWSNRVTDPIAELVKTNDKDGDGLLSAAEAEKTQHAADFKKIDTDHDNAISKYEIAIFTLKQSRQRRQGQRPGGPGGNRPRGGPFPPRQPGMTKEQQAQRIFARMDANSDGKVTAKEAAPNFAGRLAEFDADGDKALDVKEFGKLFSGMQRGNGNLPNQIFTRNDANGDGKIEAEEAQGLLKPRFADFDQNSDGVIDRQELVAWLNQGRLGPVPIETMISQQADRFWPKRPRREWPIRDDILPVETLSGKGVWIDPSLKDVTEHVVVTVWFDRQFLGDGQAYLRRAKEFSGKRRGELSAKVVQTLKALSEQSFQKAEKDLRQLVDQKQIALVQSHWIVNGFSCVATKEGLDALQQVPGAKKIFNRKRLSPLSPPDERKPEFFPQVEETKFNPDQYKHPWYARYLLADKTWKKLGVSGAGTLNIVMDRNFVLSPNVTRNLYRNPKEIPGNGKDDDGNGLIDDYHGYNFVRDDALLTMSADEPNASIGTHHGFLCASEICGAGSKECPFEFGLAPSAKWAGVVAGGSYESALEWAIEQGADTLSMSFSIPNLGEFRSHWRKMMEHATFCGVCCASGAGNNAREGTRGYAPVPVQMRTPEDIPHAVFAPAGVQRNFERTPFSSQGPVNWETEHYQDGLVDKPEFCVFNMDLPRLMPDGTVSPSGVNGNSFAGPMAAGTLALLLSADPDLLPWDARKILIETATDVGPAGFDHQTGHGLINCYRAVREVLRRKCVRDGSDPKPYEGREQSDQLDVAAIQQELQKFASKPYFKVELTQEGTAAEKGGLRTGDILESMDGMPIEAQSDVGKAIARSRETNSRKIVYKVLRDGKKLELEVVRPNEGKIGLRVFGPYPSSSPAFQ